MSGNIESIYGNPYDTSGDGMDSFDPLPAGWYPAMIEEAEVVRTKAGDGWYLKLRFYILDQQYNGRRIFTNITLQNPNQKAEQFGQKALNSLGQALGIPAIRDSTQCLNGQCAIKLKIVHDEKYGDNNEITGYKPLGSAPQQAAPYQAPIAPPLAQTNYAPPSQAYPQQPQQPAPPTYTPPPQQAPVAPPAAGGLPWKKNPEVPF